jgi:hypothetical protein
MQHLERSGKPILYIGRKLKKKKKNINCTISNKIFISITSSVISYPTKLLA